MGSSGSRAFQLFFHCGVATKDPTGRVLEESCSCCCAEGCCDAEPVAGEGTCAGTVALGCASCAAAACRAGEGWSLSASSMVVDTALGAFGAVCKSRCVETTEVVAAAAPDPAAPELGDRLSRRPSSWNNLARRMML